MMSASVCLCANSLGYPQGGGHRWVYLNWALGLCALGCEVTWLEAVAPEASAEQIRAEAAALRESLRPYGLADRIALCGERGEPLPAGLADGYLGIEDASEADLLLNFRYSLGEDVVERFCRSALVDIDPGLLQVWLSKGQIRLATHDAHFTIGETVGRPGTPIPDVGIDWRYTPPCVALDWWPPSASGPDAAFTTVSHWYADEWFEEGEAFYANDKRTGFVPFFALPKRTSQPLELALCLGGDEADERRLLEASGWRVRHAFDVAATPRAYQSYVQTSRGEFSCVKPSCIRLQNAWISDRTLCYLASGKPAVVQHTGPSCFLPDAAGVWRFRDLAGAAACLDAVAADYDRQSRQARALAEEYYDARKVAGRVLELALT
jgi:hypothetical protein